MWFRKKFYRLQILGVLFSLKGYSNIAGFFRQQKTRLNQAGFLLYHRMLFESYRIFLIVEWYSTTPLPRHYDGLP
jgi:hypothetical protein